MSHVTSHRITRRRIIMVVILVMTMLLAGLWLWTPAPRYAGWAWRRAFGGATVEQRLAQHGHAARSRLQPHFTHAGKTYPPRQLTLIAIKDTRTLEIWASDCDCNDTSTPHLHKQPHHHATRFIRSYPILAASGRQGPKLRQGDRQVPEGIYEIESLHPNSMFHLALRVNYPNATDKTHAAADSRHQLGSDIMIHGSNVSVGCLAMGDQAIEDLFVLTADVGSHNTTLIITPTDFRQPDATPQSVADSLGADAPPWLVDHYRLIQKAMAAHHHPTSAE